MRSASRVEPAGADAGAVENGGRPRGSAGSVVVGGTVVVPGSVVVTSTVVVTVVAPGSVVSSSPPHAASATTEDECRQELHAAIIARCVPSGIRGDAERRCGLLRLAVPEAAGPRAGTAEEDDECGNQHRPHEEGLE